MEGMASEGLPLCVNCDGPLTEDSLLYCSGGCEQEASYVRYYRQVLRDGRWRRTEIQEVLRIRGAVVMNGGYPDEKRTLPKAYRDFILARDDHTCRNCGDPGNQIDHIKVRGINGNINHALNLQVLCSRCHRAKTIADIRQISQSDDPELWQKLQDKSQELHRRIRAEPAERVSDDEQQWGTVWRPLQAERRLALGNRSQRRRVPAKPRLWLVK